MLVGEDAAEPWSPDAPRPAGRHLPLALTLIIRSCQAEKCVWLGFKMQDGCRIPFCPWGRET